MCLSSDLKCSTHRAVIRCLLHTALGVPVGVCLRVSACVCVCVCVCSKWICVCVSAVSEYVCLYIYVCVCFFLCTCVRVWCMTRGVWMCVCEWECVYVSENVCGVCVCVCVYVRTYVHGLHMHMLPCEWAGGSLAYVNVCPHADSECSPTHSSVHWASCKSTQWKPPL